MPKNEGNAFTVWVNFYRFDDEGNRISFPRKEKLRLEVVEVEVSVGLYAKKKATIRFADGTHVGPFDFISKWDVRNRKQQVAADYMKWLWKQERRIR